MNSEFSINAHCVIGDFLVYTLSWCLAFSQFCNLAFSCLRKMIEDTGGISHDCVFGNHCNVL